MIEVDRVHHAYGDRSALIDVSLSVEPGEIVGIVGANGSGKTTLLKVMAGLLSGRPGEVRIGGDDVERLDPRERARRVAFVPQSAEVAFEFTAGEVVLLARSPHLPGMGFEGADDVRMAREALVALDALDLADRPVTALSGGERQRVMIARAFAQDAPVLLLDEPASHLDLGHQAAVYDRLRERCEAGATVVVVSHDLNLPARFCRRILALKEGGVAAEGSPEEVITEEEIHRIFEARVRVISDGAPVVIPLAGEGAG